MGIPNPCSTKRGYKCIIAIYLKYIMLGINLRNKEFLRSSTVSGYADSVNILYKLWGFDPQVKLLIPNNMPAILINNLCKEEDIACQHSPLYNKIFTELHQATKTSHSVNSKQNTLFNIVVSGQHIGPWLSKYAQAKGYEVNYKVYTSGKKVIKAFIANDFVFYNKNNHLISYLIKESHKTATRVKVTWRIQKNHEHNLSITSPSKPDNHIICPVRAAAILILRACCMHQPYSLPVACYLKKGTSAKGPSA